MGFFPIRILERVAISFSRGSSWPRDWTHISCIGRQFLSCWATKEASCFYLFHILAAREGRFLLKKCYSSPNGDIETNNILMLEDGLPRMLLLLSHFSCVQLCVTPFLGFSRQEHWSRLPFLLQCIKVKSESEVAQSCQTLRDPMNCSLPASSVHGIFQARVLEWGAIAFSAS